MSDKKGLLFSPKVKKADFTTELGGDIAIKNTAYYWNRRMAEDRLGLTEQFGEFENVAESLGAKTVQDEDGKWVPEENVEKGVPKQMSMRLAALQNLRERAMRIYDETFQSLMESGTTLHLAEKTAETSARAFINAQMVIINKKYPQSYTTQLAKNITPHLGTKYSGFGL